MDEAAPKLQEKEVVIEVSKLIKNNRIIRNRKPDPIYRDKGQIKSGLEETNNKLLAA